MQSMTWGLIALGSIASYCIATGRVATRHIYQAAWALLALHAGLRYTYIDMDDYTVKGNEDVARFAADSMSVFSIPVGVTVAKDFTAGQWNVKPSFDLTLTANMGDDSIDGSVTWADVDNLKTNVESEVLDDWTYGATLGVAAKNGNFTLGFGVNYTGSSNTDEYGVSANARFVF